MTDNQTIVIDNPSWTGVIGDPSVIELTRLTAETMPTIKRVEVNSPNSLTYFRADDAIMSEVTSELSMRVQEILNGGKP